jgi:DNA-binding transcriptional ArsR family regulator
MVVHSGRVLETLADPTRRKVVEVLRSGERSVSEIVARVPIDQSGVSRHLRVLHSAGLVRMRPDGPRRLYSLEARPFRELEEWISGYHTLWEDRLDRLQGRLETRKTGRRQGQEGRK